MLKIYIQYYSIMAAGIGFRPPRALNWISGRRLMDNYL